ncbi:hypothetical protein IW140_001088 [Coemansia sp. RSA 1813]|nr:hypothetical protein EV178_002315 [Coemansia sp. RSA 1646]KAJ1773120.1 hypothetical protein LPJ74_000859 [Coemansia sp. RSA 1843]KAJ2091997.1 hypothetical protein IW138_001363 [Coemansia sp. RSA 986]KAJ2216666.1 hypothetical protein EV179_001205 [Coemansia sp. RSA 487]KAJ2572048.1 hypothetical protein IW140_001088 [Coemansia sp. RSA 1813]
MGLSLSPLWALLTVGIAAFVLQLYVQPAFGELIPATDSQITIEFPAEPEHSYHWWDVLTSGASEFFGPKVDDANSAFGEAEQKAYLAGKYATSNAAQLGKDVKEDAEHVGNMAKQNAGYMGKKARNDAAHMTKQAKEQAQHAGKKIKQEGHNAYRKADSGGRKLAHDVQHAVDSKAQYSSGYLHGVFSRLSSHIWGIVSATRGASSHLHADIKAGLDKLGNMVGSMNEGASPSWPEAVFDGTRDHAFSKYIHELGHASQIANDQIRSKLDIHSAMLASMARSHLSSSLKLSGCYIPILVLISLYALASNWCRNARSHQRASAHGDQKSSSGSHNLQSLEQGDDRATNNALAVANTSLAIISLASVLLAVMEFNGVAGWLVASCYTVLIAGTVAAAEPPFLAGVISSDNTAGVGLRLAIGVTAISAVSCLIHTFFG